MYVEKIPIVDVSSCHKVPVISLVKEILADPDSPDVPKLEKQIDALVYELYGLTEDEIAIVEGEIG
ncbi:hypothetical protein DRN98_04490 [Methanosarcinales archaeon]|nr:MAG: hypothetical protein DRN98_04490 [Methanosarcinales archaeon]